MAPLRARRGGATGARARARQVRAKYMALEPVQNRYVRHLRSIRAIQEYLVRRAERHAIPRVDNTNVDRSVAAIHATVFGCLRRLARVRPARAAAPLPLPSAVRASRAGVMRRGQRAAGAPRSAHAEQARAPGLGAACSARGAQTPSGAALPCRRPSTRAVAAGGGA